MSSVFVASQSSCFFLCSREQIRLVKNRLNTLYLNYFKNIAKTLIFRMSSPCADVNSYCIIFTFLECVVPEPFGLETFQIQDSQYAASSFHPIHANVEFQPQNARLNFRGTTQRSPAWSADYGDAEPWIEVDLLWIVTVSGVLTQGRGDYDQWVTSYSVSSKVDGMEFHFYLEKGQRKVWSQHCS